MTDKSDTKQVPTPLSLAVGANFLYIVNKHGVEIAEMRLPLGGGSSGTFAKRKGEAEAIITACNSHSALVAENERLRGIVEWALATIPDGDEPSWTCDARELLTPKAST